MSADRLREAANVLREVAQLATPGPWYDTNHSWIEPAVIATSSARDQDATYIAMVSPVVALALSDWLDAEARCCEEADAHAAEHAAMIRADFSSRAEALNVADAILGDRA